VTGLRVERVESIEDLREEWRALPVCSIFSTWEWTASWWRHLGGDRRLAVHAVRTGDGELTGVLPLYIWRERPVRVVRFLGHPQGDELGPIGTAPPAELAGALNTALAAIPHDVFLGEQLPGDQAWPALLAASRWRLEASPTLRFQGGWDAFVASRSANMRDQLRRRERRLRRRYGVEFRLADDEARLEGDLDVLFALHRARWGASSPFAPEAFHREVTRAALAEGRLRLWLLELDGVARAAWLGFRLGGVESYYQAGRDPDYDADSVGFVLLAHTIREALDDGVEEYRFLRGPEPYKDRFANSDPGLETVVRASSASGKAAVEAAFVARRLRNLVRQVAAKR
jgi:CelD/BcsL family acetyltransferase involved in cellulose biosynthesis